MIRLYSSSFVLVIAVKSTRNLLYSASNCAAFSRFSPSFWIEDFNVEILDSVVWIAFSISVTRCYYAAIFSKTRCKLFALDPAMTSAISILCFLQNGPYIADFCSSREFYTPLIRFSRSFTTFSTFNTSTLFATLLCIDVFFSSSRLTFSLSPIAS